MIKDPICKNIWNRVLDVVFDCYRVCQPPTSSRPHPALTKLKESATLVVRHFQKDLVGAVLQRHVPSLELPRKFLNELALNLQIAAGLGFLETGDYRFLANKVSALEKGTERLAAVPFPFNY